VLDCQVDISVSAPSTLPTQVVASHQQCKRELQPQPSDASTELMEDDAESTASTASWGPGGQCQAYHCRRPRRRPNRRTTRRHRLLEQEALCARPAAESTNANYWEINGAMPNDTWSFLVDGMLRIDEEVEGECFLSDEEEMLDLIVEQMQRTPEFVVVPGKDANFERPDPRG
jgi:hypothetical protein